MERQKKTADMATYMREYRRKQYASNPDPIKAKNKSFYYKYKFGLSGEEMALYGDLTPEVSKVLNLMASISERNPKLIAHIFEKVKIAE